MERLYRHIALLDKPAGPTSLECSEEVGRIFHAKKSGHAGTLDPGATGVLLVALDEATKAMPFLMGLDKTYEGVVHIHRDFERRSLEAAARSFTGRITQTPPVRSAVSRKPRERDIYSFEITGKSGRDASFVVRCQAGTYIRKLCSDLGERMGTAAHMKSLKRTRVGPFFIGECASPEQLGKSPGRFAIPIEAALERIGTKKIRVKEGAATKILDGSPVLPEHVEKSDPGIRNGERVGIFSGSALLALGIAKAYPGSQGIAARTERVFKPPPEPEK